MIEKFNIETVQEITFWNEKLFSFKTSRSPSFRFIPGQFSRVGLEIGGKVISRPYSMVSCDYDEYLEFLSIVVPGGELTPTLAKMKVGDSVLIDKRGLGYLTVDHFTTECEDLILLATGTGIAPFLSIIKSLNIYDKFEHIYLIHSVREESELVYSTLLRNMESNEFTYIPIVTRDSSSVFYNVRIPQYITTHILSNIGIHDKFMICGNPDMVKDTREILEAHNIHINRHSHPGQYIIENAF